MNAQHRRVAEAGAARSRRGIRVASILALVLAALAVVGSWATASPPGSSPDEDWHMASIWCPTPLDGACATRANDDGTTSVEVPQRLALAAACTAFNPSASGACVDKIPTDPTWTNRLDNGSYPGGFYDVMHLFVGDDLTGSVMTMRLVNGAVAVALLGVALVALTGTNRRLVVYGGLIVAMPNALYVVASINPSGWAVTGVAAAWIGLHGLVTETERWRRLTLLGVAVAGAVMAANARGDAGAFVGLAALAMAVLHFDRLRADWRLALAPVGVAAIGVLGFFSGTHSSAVTGGVYDGADGGHGLLVRNIFALPALLIDSVVGDLNWLDTPMPGITWVPVTVFATAIAFVGLRSMNWRKGLALTGTVFAFCALPLLLLQLSGAPVGEQIQGRYLTPIVPIILWTALWNPVRNTVERMTTAQTVVVFIAVVTAHAGALHTQIRRFATGLDNQALNLDFAREWWVSPIGANATWLLGSLGFAILAATLFCVRRTGSAPEDGTSDVLQRVSEPAPAS